MHIGIQPETGWIDWSQKVSARACLNRIDELKKEKPDQVFRCIERLIAEKIKK